MYDITTEIIDRKILQIEALKTVLNEMVINQDVDTYDIDSITNNLDNILEELIDLKLIV